MNSLGTVNFKLSKYTKFI